MKKNFIALLLVMSACLVPSSLSAGGKITVTDLKCRHLENPVGVDSPAPELSWKILSVENNVLQEGYRILVATSAEALAKETGDMWDSGWVECGESIYIPYGGVQLESGQDYFWKVKIKTNRGESGWSETARWTMGLVDPGQWQAVWIGLDRTFEGDKREGDTRLAARYLRKEFEAGPGVKKAMLHISGLGLYEAYINGRRIGTQVLSPTPTDYGKSVKYNSFDVTENIAGGRNAIGVALGNGRFFTMREPGVRHFGFPKLLLQLVVEYDDGTSEVIASDRTWKITADGPIRANNEFDGEEYDARMEMPGWNKPGFDDGAWMQAEAVEAPAGILAAQTNPNIEIMEEIKPISVTEIRPGVFIMDMGQNMVGWLEMKVRGKAGQTVKLRFAELLQDDGSLYMDNLRGARVTDLYTLKEGGEQVWEPSFTYHGFRFVEITGYPGTPTIGDFTGKVIYDKMALTGSFETSNATINRIYKNAYWGIRGNYRGMPTDCPQRDERMGWLGDRAVGSLGESFVFDNNLLYEKWLADIEEAQLENGALADVSPNYWMIYNNDVTWPAAYIIIADMLHKQYGNDRPIKKHYASMKKWMEYMADNFMEDNIITTDTYGDWCMPPESPRLIHSEDPARKTDGQLLSTSFFYDLLLKMENFCVIAGHPGDAAGYSELAERMLEAYNKKFFDPATARYSNNTVTGNLLSLGFGMVPQGYEQRVFANIVEKTMGDFDGHVSTGLIGIQQLMRRLSDYGRADIAYLIATNRDYPSWGYMIENGATTIWELWNGNTADPAMNSANHVMLLGDLLVWYYEYLAGIRNSDGSLGFKQITMKPHPVEGLDYVNATYDCVRGEIKSNWKKSGGTFEWDITIPANATAVVYIPCGPSKSVKYNGSDITESNDITLLGFEDGYAKMEAGSGSYSFTAAME